jgi:anaerobic selenocysteine-containing dehydrogenase
MDYTMTDTAKLSDIVLPAIFPLESYGFSTRSTGKVTVIEKAINPPGECRSDMMFWCELGRRMGYEEYFPWTSDKEYCDMLLAPLKRAREFYTKDEFEWISHYSLNKNVYRSYEKEGFRTHSGKVEIYSQYLEDLGICPLPIYREPAESPYSTPDLAKKYPLICTTGARRREYMHSQFRNIPSIRALYPENYLEINPIDAQKLGLEDGDLVVVESIRGRISLKAKFTDILEGVVSMMHGWSEANVNILTDDSALNEVTSSPGTRAFLCKVEKA